LDRVNSVEIAIIAVWFYAFPIPIQAKPKSQTTTCAMASSSFRNSINSLGWSRRERDVPATTSQRGGILASLQSLNPFQDQGYVRLPTTEATGAPLPAPSRREEEEGWFVRMFVMAYLVYHHRAHVSPLS